jgi:hypothetical protein
MVSAKINQALLSQFSLLAVFNYKSELDFGDSQPWFLDTKQDSDKKSSFCKEKRK